MQFLILHLKLIQIAIVQDDKKKLDLIFWPLHPALQGIKLKTN